MPSNLHFRNGDLYQGDHLPIPDADGDTDNVMINVSNLETKRADHSNEDKVITLRCENELLRSNHRELQGDHNLLERENGDLQDKVTLRNENERLSNLLHRQVRKCNID